MSVTKTLVQVHPSRVNQDLHHQQSGRRRPRGLDHRREGGSMKEQPGITCGHRISCRWRRRLDSRCSRRRQQRRGLLVGDRLPPKQQPPFLSRLRRCSPGDLTRSQSCFCFRHRFVSTDACLLSCFAPEDGDRERDREAGCTTSEGREAKEECKDFPEERATDAHTRKSENEKGISLRETAATAAAADKEAR